MLNFSAKLKSSTFGQEKGVAVYLAVVALSILMAVAIGVSLISFYWMKNMKDIGNSVIAFAAAETGIEWAEFQNYSEPSLLDITNYTSVCPDTDGQYVCFEGSLGEAVYTVTASETDCPKDLCIRSTGAYKGTRRTIRIAL